MIKTFDDIRKDNLLLYEYVRGSHCHGIATPESDIDEGGVYLASCEQIIGLGLDYQDQIENESHDIAWFELQKFMKLLLKSNPTMLEALFIDDKYVKYESPIFTNIKQYKDKFLTKKCFDSFYAYGKSQIKKAQGLNKLINWDIPERKEVLDFCYTFYKQGSTKIINWLSNRGLKQEYCGLVNVPNMPTIFACYYDWGQHFDNEGITFDTLRMLYSSSNASPNYNNMISFINEQYNINNIEDLYNWYKNVTRIIKGYGYKGIINKEHTSNELRLSSVKKDEKPICYISYYIDSYKQHCKKWKEYQEWVKHRNPVRYESNLNKSYDGKNLSEAFRLMNCGIEIANGEGFKVDRTNIDREFLLDVRNHKFEYEDLIDRLNKKKEEMEIAMKNSTIPDDIDTEFVNNLLIDIRKEQLKIS